MYEWLKFGHLLGLALLAAGMGVQTVAYVRLRRASTVAEIRTWQKLPVESVTGIGLLLLLVTGLGMTGQSWSFTDAWIITALMLVVVVFVAAGAVQGPRLRRLDAALTAAGEARDASPELLAHAQDPVLHGGMRVVLLTIAEIIFLMVHKPGWTGIAVSLVVVAVLAAAVCWPLVAGGRTAPGTAQPPTA
jgi:thiosulfate reductase cytochrome b subunit